MIRPTDTDFQRYKIGVRKFNEMVGIKTESGHRLTDRLPGRRLCIRKPDSLFKTNRLCSAEHFEGYVGLCFHPGLREYLLLKYSETKAGVEGKNNHLLLLFLLFLTVFIF